MRPVVVFLTMTFIIVALLFVPMTAEAQQCGVNGFGVQSFGQPVFVNSFGVHPQFQRNGFVGVSAFPVQAFANPVFVNRGFNRGAVNVNVNSRRGVFGFRRPSRTSVNVNRFGGLNVNIR